MNVLQYLNWVEAALLDGSDFPTREALADYLYEVPEYESALDPETWGTDAAAEESQRAMMELMEQVG